MKNQPIIAALLALLMLAACGDNLSTSPTRDELILVTGATGSQGGAVARELVNRGFRVRGLTRNPEGANAVALRDYGVQMVKGDFEDPETLKAAMAGAYGVFAVTDFWEHGFETEIAHGKALIDAAKAAGIRHFVFTSVAGANDFTGIPHFQTKAQIEIFLRESGLPYSIVRPVEFMDNVSYDRKNIFAGVYYDPRDSGKTHQWIAVSDIGVIVGDAFARPDVWIGRELDIAGDQLTIAAYVDALSRAAGLDVHHQQITWAAYEAQAGEEMTMMLRWFDKGGYAVDIAALRKEYPKLLTYQQFLDRLAWN